MLSALKKLLLLQPLWPLMIFSLTDPKTVEEEESNFSSPLMLWLQQEQKRKESIAEKKPKKGLVFEISSDDGFQICSESIEGEWALSGQTPSFTCTYCQISRASCVLLGIMGVPWRVTFLWFLRHLSSWRTIHRLS